MPKMAKKSSLQFPISDFRFLKAEYLLLLVIFLLSIALRINFDPAIPFHYDPGKNIVYAKAVLEWFPLFPQSNPFFNLGEYYEYQVLFPYISAFFHIISGLPLVFVTKWVAILSGAALTLTVYFFTDELFDNKTAALISAFLIAVSKVQLLQYMNYYPQILATTLIPLSLLFLVRFIRTHEWKDFILVVLLSSLIILGSYIAALVYFLILLLSLAIWSFFEKETIRTLILIPGFTVLLLTFFWLPMVWRHGFYGEIETALLRIFTTSGSFTNQSWTITTFLTYSNGAVIAILAVICVFLITKKIQWDFQKILLSSWLFISLFLMSSYLFYPILWVDRFSPFLDIAVIICAGGALNVIITIINNVKFLPEKAGYLLLILLLIPLFGAVTSDVVFFSWGYPSDFDMVNYLEQSIPPDSLVVAPPGIQGFWVSALSGVRILGGESSQMLGHAYLGEDDSSTIINSPDVEEKMKLIRKYGVNYIFLPLHEGVPTVWNPGYRVAGISAFSNGTYFEQVNSYSDSWGRTVLLKVREDLKPHYNQLSINWTVTAIGYVITLLTLCGLIYNRRLNRIIAGLFGKSEDRGE